MAFKYLAHLYNAIQQETEANSMEKSEVSECVLECLAWWYVLAEVKKKLKNKAIE